MVIGSGEELNAQSNYYDAINHLLCQVKNRLGLRTWTEFQVSPNVPYHRGLHLCTSGRQRDKGHHGSLEKKSIYLGKYLSFQNPLRLTIIIHERPFGMSITIL